MTTFGSHHGRASRAMTLLAAATAGVLLATGCAGAAVTPTAVTPTRQAAGTTIAGTGASAGHIASTQPAKVTLPRPTGAYQVGTVDLHLIDHHRRNPWATSPAYRELMASVYYPTTDTHGRQRAPQFPAGVAAAVDTMNGGDEMGLPTGAVDWGATRTWAYQDAPVDSRAGTNGRLPVLLYSPGAGDPRGWDTTLVEDLASQGYVVVSIDPTYDASAVEFPGRRVVTTLLPSLFTQAQREGTTTALYRKVVAVRAADVSFTLDELSELNAGHDVDAERRPLPAGLTGSLDLGHVGMFGQSAGGATAAQAMYDDPRIKAGVDMDGILEYAGDPTPGAPLMPAAAHGIDRPFLLLGSQSSDGESLASDPSWRAFYDHDTSWVRDITMTGSRHASYTDAETLVPQAARRLGLPASIVTDDVGTIAPARAVNLEQVYLSAFFDRWLRGGHDTLVNGPSPAYPEMVFQH